MFGRSLLGGVVVNPPAIGNNAVIVVTFPAVLELFAFLAALWVAGQAAKALRVVSLVRTLPDQLPVGAA